MHPAGPLLLLALTRWRRPEARLVAAFALVPHSTLFYEALPLLVLVPRTRQQLLALLLLNWIGTLVEAWLVFLPGFEWRSNVYVVGELMLAFAYLPALIVVLRRPNVAPDDAPLPAWAEQAARAMSRLGDRVGLRPAGAAVASAWKLATAPLAAK